MRIGTALATFAAIAFAATIAGCATKPPAAPAEAPGALSTADSAQANLAAASGSLVSGRVTLRPMGNGVHLTGTVGGFLPNSTHAIHVHEKGDCSAADASRAGWAWRKRCIMLVWGGSGKTVMPGTDLSSRPMATALSW